MHPGAKARGLYRILWWEVGSYPGRQEKVLEVSWSGRVVNVFLSCLSEKTRGGSS